MCWFLISVYSWWFRLRRSSWLMSFPPTPPLKQGLHCSVISQVLRHHPTPGLRQHQFFGFSPSLTPPFYLLPLARELAGSPDSRVESVRTCCRSLTPPKPTIPCHNGTANVAFPFVIQGLPSNLSDFGVQYCACGFPCQRFPMPLLVIKAWLGAMMVGWTFHMRLFHSLLSTGFNRRFHNVP